MIKKYIRFLFLFVLIYCSLYIYKIVIREENIRNTYMYINDYYLLSSFGWDEESNSVFLKIVNKKNYISCIIVQDLFNYKDKYVVGKVGIENYDYLDCEEELKYKGYFYINFDNKDDAKFNLTEKEIKNKFSSQIKYLKARKFLNEYGEGNLAPVEEAIIIGIFLQTLIIIFFIIILRAVIFYLLNLRMNRKS